MKFVMWCVVLLFSLTIPVLAQHEPASPRQETATERAGEPPSEGEHGKLEIWKWANFLLLAGLIGYMIGKNAGPFFDSRSKQIRKGMIEAEETLKEAKARAAGVDQRLANLAADIEALQLASQQQRVAEEQRIRRQTAEELAKLQQHAEREIESAGKAARLELKRYSAELAVALAEQKLRTRIDASSEDELVRGFVWDLQASDLQAR